MDREDFGKFRGLWNSVLETYRQPPCSDAAAMLEFHALQRYSMLDLSMALMAHKQDPDAGRFPPTAAHVIRRIDGIPDPEHQGPAYAMLPAHVETPEEARARRERDGESFREAKRVIDGLGLRIRTMDGPGDRGADGLTNRQRAERELRRVRQEEQHLERRGLLPEGWAVMAGKVEDLQELAKGRES